MEDFVTRYSIEYYPGVDDDEDRRTDYVYADSDEEAMAAFQERHGEDCVVTMCEPVEVPAQYKVWDEEAAVDAIIREAAARRVVPMPEEVLSEDEAAARAFRRDNPGVTLANSGWAGCRVTFYRDMDGNRTSVDLPILPENYFGERDGFLLTVEERQMAYEELKLRGVPIEGYVIEKAEMFKFIKDLNLFREPSKIDDILKNADLRSDKTGREGKMFSELVRIECFGV